MAGLSILLETQRNPQILRKADALRLSQTFPARRPDRHSTFLEECFLCGRHLSLEKEIYMYRGDRAFCSEECRRRQMVMDEAELRREMNCSRHRKGANKGHVAVRGGFAY